MPDKNIPPANNAIDNAARTVVSLKNLVIAIGGLVIAVGGVIAVFSDLAIGNPEKSIANKDDVKIQPAADYSVDYRTDPKVYANKQPYYGIVDLFLSKKSLLGKYYYRSLQQIRDDDRKKKVFSTYSDEDLEQALKKLVDIGVLVIQPNTDIIRYGLSHNSSLAQFRKHAGL